MYKYILYKIRDADFECNIRSITFIVLTNLPLQISDMTLSHYVFSFCKISYAICINDGIMESVCKREKILQHSR